MDKAPLLLIPVLLLCVGCSYRSEKADLIVHNAIIHSMDPEGSVHQAMAIRDGRILELGPEQQIRNKYSATNIHDAAGSHVYPGFIDGHCHFFGYGLNKQKLDLSGTADFSDVLERVVAYAAADTGTGWILGRGWDHTRWPLKAYPDNTELNRLFPDRPVLLQRVDGHAAIVNQRALDVAGLSATSQIAGGLLELRNGKPTGLLLDNAVDVFQTIFDGADEQTKRKALLDAEKDCFAAGLTMVCDAGLDTGTIALIQRMQERGELKMRVYAMVADRPEHLAYYSQAGPIVSDRLIVRSVKVYADGALGSRGALLLAPYKDVDTVWHGLQLGTAEHFNEVADWCLRHGFQMATHCSGDSANRLLLDIYGAHLESGNDLRWRIEHAQVVSPADLSKFKEKNVLPSVQPTHAVSDRAWAEERLGAERIGHAYAYEQLRQQTGLIPLGTDFPVEAIDPLGTFYAAVLRTTGDGQDSGNLHMENALSREHALAGITMHNAIATFTEQDLGSLEVNKRADLVILDRDILTVGPKALLRTRVLATFVDGERVH